MSLGYFGIETNERSDKHVYDSINPLTAAHRGEETLGVILEVGKIRMKGIWKLEMSDMEGKCITEKSLTRLVYFCKL